jgi:hypothetical protein
MALAVFLSLIAAVIGGSAGSIAALKWQQGLIAEMPESSDDDNDSLASVVQRANCAIGKKVSACKKR